MKNLTFFNFLFYMFFNFALVNGQNLIVNGGFEDNTPIIQIGNTCDDISDIL